MTYLERTSELPAPRRADMITRLRGQFYIDEQAQLATNGLSTEILVFPSDRLPQNAEALNTKIRHSLDYATRAIDIYPLNALRHVAGVDADRLTFRALFLALSEECNRLNKPMTFLTALRRAGASLAIDEKFSQPVLAAKVKQALSLLDMQNYAPLIDSWQKQGNFTIHDEFNGRNPDGSYHGSYIALARSIDEGHSYGLNHTISFILGNRLRIQGESPETMLAMARRYANFPNAMRDRMYRGESMRADLLKEAIEKLAMPPAPLADKAQADAILSYLPDTALELLWREGYSIAYASHGNDITAIYPKDDLPGLSRLNNDSARQGKALRQIRYHSIFLSNGNRLDQADHDNPTLCAQIAAQSLCHETGHLAFANLNGPETTALRRAIESLSPHIRQLPENALFDEACTTIDTNNLRELLDHTSPHYTNYRQSHLRTDTRWEEVACNLFGLMHTELKGRTSELFAACPPLEPAWRAVEQAIMQGTLHCRETRQPVASPQNGRT